MGVGIIEAEIRSGQYEVLLEAARLVLTDATPIEIARRLQEMAERTIRPTSRPRWSSTPRSYPGDGASSTGVTG
jgi:hypothetical protein